MLFQRAARAAGFWFVLASLGCAGDGPPPTASTGNTFAELQASVFTRYCAVGPCHSAGVGAGGLVLEGPSAYDQLVNAPPENSAALEVGWQRVVPGVPDRSFLWIKLTGPGLGQGSRMPLGAPPLPEQELRRIEEWILAGAPRGGEAVGGVGTPTPSPSPSPTPIATLNPPSASFAALESQVLRPRCAVAFCHDATTRAGGLDLTAAYDDLVGVPPTNVAARDAGWLRVTPGQPQASFLLVKLTLSAFDERWGSPMPLVGARLEPLWIEALTAWIEAGAPNN
ncbi:MAG: hypothetical protein N3C12_01235 [Candidatus Binatia bacterium]|nr:hypothetical protein [Candidatus Binatia bacterium]